MLLLVLVPLLLAQLWLLLLVLLAALQLCLPWQV
jgi:hypothetical protein